MRKHPTNKNLNVIKATTFENLPITRPEGRGAYEFIEQYLVSNKRVMNDALNTHRRTIAIRVDLRFPCNYFDADYPKVFNEIEITRFIKSFKSKVESLLNQRRREIKSTSNVYNTSVNYIWVCECGEHGSYHYHLVLFLNNDTFRSLGFKSSPQESSNLVNMIVEAWESALNISFRKAWDLVSIPPKASYKLIKRDSPEQDINYRDLFNRISYFAKVITKVYGVSRNAYGCSRRRNI
ncbi:inovirus Gp2 family protein [Psychromonas arctica]|uniref:inovirus Gp2 family protein n=1 Tax=Psychromonas arctica TaxID=168275 RepID=UPI000427C2F4|nr:inovirus Gp2 family protein [Psychromonas arctica]